VQGLAECYFQADVPESDKRVKAVVPAGHVEVRYVMRAPHTRK
jgi:hypothetical protein